MSESLLALRWNNHRSTFFHVLNSIKQKEIYSDATIACDGKFYPVHKLVLATCSEYFEAMFSRTQCKHPIIVLKDIGHEEVEALLNYMYIGEVNVVQNDLAGLIKAAECLRIKGLAVPDEDNSNTTKNSTALLRKHYDNATTRPSVVEDESPRPHKRRKRDKSEEAQDRVGTSPAVVASPLNTPAARQEGNESIQRINSQETNTLSGDRCQDLPDTESSQMYAKVVMSEPSIKREVSDDLPHDLESSVSEEQHLLQGDYSYDGKLSSAAQISEVETKLEPTDYGSTHDPNLAPLPGTSIAHGVWQTGEEMPLGSMGPLEAAGGSEVLLPQGGQQQQQQPGFTPSQQMGRVDKQGSLDQQRASPSLHHASSPLRHHSSPPLHHPSPPLHHQPPSSSPMPRSISTAITTTTTPPVVDVTTLLRGVGVFTHVGGSAGSGSTVSVSGSGGGTGGSVNSSDPEFRPFPCPICPYRSKHKNDLQKHIRTHTGEKPYQCPFCVYKATTQSNLHKHVRRGHLDFFKH